jgi:FkbM family methyltransferase
MSLILDVGMNDGADTAFYLAKGFRVVAVEADPTLVNQARQRFARELRDGSLTIVDKAIGQTKGTVQFYVHRYKNDWSTTNPAVWPASDVDPIEVESVTFDSVLRQYGVPYYLKIDIEGADIHVISSLSCATDLPTYVSAEAQTPDIVDKLYDLGYRDFKLVDQAPTARTPLPWIPKEGRYVDLTFGWYHSGPFGEETPGPWQRREEVFRKFHQTMSSPAPSWYDFHAKLPTAKRATKITDLRWLPLTALRYSVRQTNPVAARALKRVLPAGIYSKLKGTFGS